MAVPRSKLKDCERHGPDSELLIVEGDSAAKSVEAVRNVTFQAVLPMQGKPLNAHKASAAAIRGNGLYQSLLLALRPGTCEPLARSCRYGRIVLLFDPDADGIHCGALMMMFFRRALPDVISDGRLLVVRAPLYRFQVDLASGGSRTLYAYTDEEGSKLLRELKQEGYGFERQRFRGLASLEPQLLKTRCLDPTSRTAFRVTPEDAQAAVRIFGGTQDRGRRNG